MELFASLNYRKNSVICQLNVGEKQNFPSWSTAAGQKG